MADDRRSSGPTVRVEVAWLDADDVIDDTRVKPLEPLALAVLALAVLALAVLAVETLAASTALVRSIMCEGVLEVPWL
jgi:hypothetical protein